MERKAPSGSRQACCSQQSVGSLGHRWTCRAESSFGYCHCFFVYANPEVRQINADLLRATVDALAPAVEDMTLEGRINAVLVGE